LCFGRLDYKNAKKRNFETATLSDELANCIPETLAESELEDKIIGEIMTAFLNTLSKDHRMIFMRRYWLCEPISDVANHLKVSESKVKTSLHRTRIKLKTYLEMEGISI
jgi:RNA polymerase sigma-70 factor (ECF subfamily)